MRGPEEVARIRGKSAEDMPERAFWPLWPRPPVFPLPLPAPRPLRYACRTEPSAGDSSLNFMFGASLLLFGNLQYGFKVLGNGKLTKKVTVKANAFSASAKEAIEAAGGKAEVKLISCLAPPYFSSVTCSR